MAMTECGNYKGLSLVVDASIMITKIFIQRLSDYCECVGILPAEQICFPPNRSITDMMISIRRNSSCHIRKGSVKRGVYRSHQNTRLLRPNTVVKSAGPLWRAGDDWYAGMRGSRQQ